MDCISVGGHLSEKLLIYKGLAPIPVHGSLSSLWAFSMSADLSHLFTVTASSLQALLYCRHGYD